MTSPSPNTKYIMMDQTSYRRDYYKAFDEKLSKETLPKCELKAEFEQFDRLLKEALCKKWDSSSDSDIHFEISDEWQGTLHHCGGIYSEEIYCPDYIGELLSVMGQLPHATHWVYHTACEFPELWNGDFFLRYPNVYFPKDGNDYVGAFVPPGTNVEYFCGADPMIHAREAARDGDLAGLQRILESDPALLNSKDDSGETPLHHAAAKGHVRMVRFLLEVGADLEAKDSSGNTPLFSAVYGTSSQVVLPILLDAGAEVNLVSEYDYTPLEAAKLRGDSESVALLLDAGAVVKRPADGEVNDKGRES